MSGLGHNATRGEEIRSPRDPVEHISLQPIQLSQLSKRAGKRGWLASAVPPAQSPRVAARFRSQEAPRLHGSIHGLGAGMLPRPGELGLGKIGGRSTLSVLSWRGWAITGHTTLCELGSAVGGRFQ